MRLIDADLMDNDAYIIRSDVEKIIRQCCDSTKSNEIMHNIYQWCVPQVVSNEPTAYDIDKVVEEIKKESYVDGTISVKKAIEIVKAGGNND